MSKKVQMKNLKKIISKGMHDFNTHNQSLYNQICNKVKNIIKKYHFEEISTPIIESKEIFEKSSGELSDIVSKEMYQVISNEGINKIESKKNESNLVLRPEGTASFARFIYDQKLTQTLPQRFFSYGPMFRHENPQSGRYRQFHQFSVEHFESKKNPINDAELIISAFEVLKALNIHATLEFNSIGDEETKIKYQNALKKYFEKYKDQLSPLNQKRLNSNPLRILDSKEDRDIIERAPNIQLYLSENSRLFVEKFEGYLKQANIESFLNTKLVRGIDYYQDIIFEFKVDGLTVLAGGRYDGLVNKISNSKDYITSLGWSLGIDRVMMLTKNHVKHKSTKIAFVPQSDEYLDDAFKISNFFRSCGVGVSIISEGKVSKSIAKADKSDYTHVLVYGEDEKKSESVLLKDLKTGKQINLSINKVKDITRVD